MSLTVEIRKGGKGRKERDRGRDRGEGWGEEGKEGEKRGKKGRRIYWSHGSNMTDKLIDANSLNNQVKVQQDRFEQEELKSKTPKSFLMSHALVLA